MISHLIRQIGQFIVNANNIEFFRFVRGVKERKILSKEQLESFEFTQLSKAFTPLVNLFIGQAKLLIKNQEFMIVRYLVCF